MAEMNPGANMECEQKPCRLLVCLTIALRLRSTITSTRR